MAKATKILIVEDDPLIAELYAGHFRSQGVDVVLREDGGRALDYLKGETPDAAVLDLMLPRVSGLDILRFIRSEERLKHLPCVVLSNAYLGNMVHEAWKAGTDRCLTKVFTKPPQVLEIVRSLLAERRAAGMASAAEDLENAPSERAEALKGFRSESPRILATIRKKLTAVVKTEMDEAYLKWLEERSMLMQEMYQHLHELCGRSGAAGYVHASQLASAQEALLQELSETPQNMTPSVLRTFAAGIDYLAMELTEAPRSYNADKTTPVALVVDDEAFSRRAVISGLEKVGLANVAVNNPADALELLGDRVFDIIFLDVDMPGMNGFDACVKIREMSQHQQTPIVFVTGVSDFNARAKSSLSGGDDLIAKPFLPIELAVKALTHLYRRFQEIDRKE